MKRRHKGAWQEGTVAKEDIQLLIAVEQMHDVGAPQLRREQRSPLSQPILIFIVQKIRSWSGCSPPKKTADTLVKTLCCRAIDHVSVYIFDQTAIASGRSEVLPKLYQISDSHPYRLIC
jgi:hypothetical protein